MIETNSKAKSQFVGYFGVKNYAQIKKNLIEPKVKDFFDVRNIQNPKEIEAEGIFADKDFLDTCKPFMNPFFYEFIVDGIHKNSDGKIEIPVTYCITLDETNCSKICEQTQIRYDEILLFDTPVFYFIYLDIKVIFSCLKNQNNETY